MAKKSNKGIPKKKGLADYWIFIAIAALLLIIGTWGGYVAEETAGKNGKPDFEKALAKAGEYADLESIKSAVKSAVSCDGYARMGGMYLGGAGLIIFVYQISKTPKRFHRKGEEHGSARWGTDKEKAIVGDANDFYNNAILAADVLLVIDRKKRDENALTKKERKKAEKEKLQKAEAENRRIENIEKEIHEFNEIGKKDISLKKEVIQSDQNRKRNKAI